MLIESFIMRGFKNMPNMDGSFTEVIFTSKEIENDFPDEKEILKFIGENDLDRVEVVKSYQSRIETNTRNIDGYEVPVVTEMFSRLNTLEVEVGTTGVQGGDSGHGCRTYLRIEDRAGTDIKVNLIPESHKGNGGVEIVLGGDSELNTIIDTLEFAAHNLKLKFDE